MRKEIPALSAWRMPFFYFAHFFSVGVLLPFLNLYFHGIGIGGAQLGLLNAAPRLATALAPPLLGAVADKFRSGREVLLACNLLSVVFILGMWGTKAFLPLFVLITLYASAKGALLPIAENACLRDLAEHGGQYGRVRWWGSLGFIVAALGAGWLVEKISAGVIFPLVGASGLALFWVIYLLPREEGGVQSHFGGALAGLMKNRALLVFLGASILASISAGPFLIFFSIHLWELGFSAGVIGLAWAVGVVSEIFFMFNAQAIQRRFGLRAMIAAGIIGTALRWELVAWATGGAALVAIQTLHGVSFGLYHTAAVQYVDTLSSPATKNTAQSLYSASIFGLGSTVGALLAGWLLPIWGFVSLLHAGAVLAALAGFLFVLFSYLTGKKGVKKEGGRPTGRRGLAP